MDQPFDLSTVDPKPRSNAGVEMQLLSAGRPVPNVFILVRGRDCDAYQLKSDDIVARDLARGQLKQTPEEKNAEFWELQATLVAGWRPRLALAKGEQALEYSPQNAAKLLERHKWIFEQVLNFSRDRENFLPGPEQSSSGS